MTWVEYNGSTYYRMDGLTGEYCNFITDHRVSYKPRPVLSHAYYTLKNDPNGDYLYSTAFRDHILYTRLSARRVDQMSQNQITSVLVSPSGGESKKQFINDPAVVAYCAALKEEKYRAQEAKDEERSNIDDENPMAKKEEDPAAKTFQKNTNSGWYGICDCCGIRRRILCGKGNYGPRLYRHACGFSSAGKGLPFLAA